MIRSGARVPSPIVSYSRDCRFVPAWTLVSNFSVISNVAWPSSSCPLVESVPPVIRLVATVRRVVGEALGVARRMRELAVVTETVADLDVEGAIVGSSPATREVYKARSAGSLPRTCPC
jgi:hypothetical protein